jgi:hypothetical protein
MVSDLQRATAKGDYKTALEIQDKLTALHDVMFCETNPIPVKYAASLLGLCSDEVRLPLTNPSELSKKRIKKGSKKRSKIKEAKTKKQKVLKGGSCEPSNEPWPTNHGCHDDEKIITLDIGKIIDRFGSNFGYFFGTPEYTFAQRGLNKFNNDDHCENEYEESIEKGKKGEKEGLIYNKYKVLKPFDVKTCRIKPHFTYPGGGYQYRTFEGSLVGDDKNIISFKKGKALIMYCFISSIFLPVNNFNSKNKGIFSDNGFSPITFLI